MSDLKQWIDNRGIKGEEYLGDLCRNNHEYLDTGKSIRCKRTVRKGSVYGRIQKNGKCVCCIKRQRDESYKNNLETKKNYYETNKECISKRTKEKYRINMLDPVFRQNRIESRRIERRKKGCELRENITLWTAIKNAGAPTVIDLIQKQIKENKVFDQNKNQRIKYRTNLEFNLYVKLKRGMQKAKDRGLPYEKIDIKDIINKIYLYNQCCAYCDTRLNLLIANQDNSLEMDHIVSFSNG